MIQGTPADYQLLAQLTFEGVEISTFLEYAERITINPLSFSIFDRQYQNFYSPSHHHYPDYDTYTEQEQTESDAHVFQYMSIMQDEPVYTHTEHIAPYKQIRCWVKNKEHCIGILCISETKIAIESIDFSLVKFISKCLAHLYAHIYAANPQLSMDRILDGLISERINNALQLSTLASEYALHSDVQYTLLVYKPPEARIEFVNTCLRNQLSLMFGQCWSCWDKTHFIVLLDSTLLNRPRSSERIQQIAKQLDCPICISPSYADLLETRLIYERMISLPHFKHCENHAVFYLADYPECSLIYASHLRSDDIHTLLSPLYLKIVAHDQENNTQYLITLLTYLRCSCSVSKTARQLFIHANSVLYRINRLQELFDFDLSDENAVFGILFSARLQEYC